MAKSYPLSKSKNYILIIITSIISGSWLFYDYQSLKSKHERLESSGIEVKITSHPYTAASVDYVSYYFITHKGDTIESFAKCGNDYAKYASATALYNPQNPHEYDLSFIYKNYSNNRDLILYLILFWPGMTLVLYNAINFFVVIYLEFKRRYP
jgi:hypothetical protein